MTAMQMYKSHWLCALQEILLSFMNQRGRDIHRSSFMCWTMSSREEPLNLYWTIGQKGPEHLN